MKPQFSLKSVHVACVVMAIVSAVVAPLARRLSFGSGAIVTWETDDGVIELVGVGPTRHGLVALVVLIALSTFGLAFVVHRTRKAMRKWSTSVRCVEDASYPTTLCCAALVRPCQGIRRLMLDGSEVTGRIRAEDRFNKGTLPRVTNG